MSVSGSSGGSNVPAAEPAVAPRETSTEHAAVEVSTKKNTNADESEGAAPCFSNKTYIFAITFFYYMGLVLWMSPLPAMFTNRACVRMGVELGEACIASQEAQQQSASDTSNLFLAAGLPAWLAISFIGELADVIGRKKVVTAVMASTLLTVLLPAVLPDNDYWLLFALTCAFSLLGGQFAVTGLLLAMLSDETGDEPREKQAGMMALLVGTMQVGLVIAPFLAGVLFTTWEPLPYIVGAVLVAIAIGMVLFLFTESLSEENRATFSWMRAQPAGGIMLLLTKPASRLVLFIYSMSFTAIVGLAIVLPNILAPKFGWDGTMIGAWQSTWWAGTTVGQLLLVAPSLKYFGIKKTVIGSILFSFLQPAFYFANTQAAAFAIAIFGWSYAMYDGPVRQIANNAFDATKVGIVQNGITSLQTLLQVAGPQIYANILGNTPDAPYVIYVVCAAMIVCSLTSSFFIPSDDRPEAISRKNRPRPSALELVGTGVTEPQDV